MKKTITCIELNQWINEERDFVILDVLPPEYYGSRHIPRAINACIYEMNFLDQFSDLVRDVQTCIVVYDSSAKSMASACAARKLASAGYQQVLELVGGMDEWEGSGYPVDVVGPDIDEEAVITDGLHQVDRNMSRLEWTGRNIWKRHHGTVSIKNGELRIEKGMLTGGFVTMDMGTIRDVDLADDTLNAILIRHLSSDDFFDVDQYPTATFEIMGCSAIPGATPGTPNCAITGTLTIKDISREILVHATVVAGENSGVRAHSCFDIDRTQWNINYGSGKIFEKLGMHLVNDIISLELFLTAP